MIRTDDTEASDRQIRAGTGSKRRLVSTVLTWPSISCLFVRSSVPGCASGRD